MVDFSFGRKMSVSLNRILIPQMRGEQSNWGYCGDVAAWVEDFAIKAEYSARRPLTEGHCFALVGQNEFIVDLWESNGDLVVKIFPSDYGNIDPDYIWWDAGDTVEDESLLESIAKTKASSL